MYSSVTRADIDPHPGDITCRFYCRHHVHMDGMAELLSFAEQFDALVVAQQ